MSVVGRGGAGDRKGKDGVGKSFGHGVGDESEGVGVAWLAVHRGGVVDVEADGVFAEVVDERGAVGGGDYVLVEDVLGGVGRHFRQGDARRVNFRVVDCGQFAAVIVFSLGVGEFHVECGSLQGIHAAVETAVQIVVALGRTIVGECAHGVGQAGVGGRDRSGVAEGAYSFCGVERECRGIADGAGDDASGGGSDCLCVVFDDQEVVAAGYVGQLG